MGECSYSVYSFVYTHNFSKHPIISQTPKTINRVYSHTYKIDIFYNSTNHNCHTISTGLFITLFVSPPTYRNWYRECRYANQPNLQQPWGV